MTTFTDDKELIKEIKERISSLDVRDNIERRAYEIALASLEAKKRLMENTSATDAFLAEVRAQGVEMFSEKFGGGTPLSNMVKEVAADFAAKLRKGGNQ
ncbi:phage protein [Escherichia coli]|nr:phage protein [Escherichia coli]